MPAEPQAAFFSYSRDDSEFALRLAADLKAAGANVWLDQLDIGPGQRWARTVQDALNNCPRLLVILSPSSVSSTNVEDEVAFALEEHKTVIPVFYRDCKVPFQLRPFQYVDLRTDYDRGLKTLLRTLGAEQQAVAPAGAAVSAVPKDTAADVSDADERKRAAEQQRLEQEEKQTAEQARLEGQERERLATEEKNRQQKLDEGRQAAAEQARLQEERRLAAEKAQREEQERERKAAEEKARPFLTKKTMIGLAVGVVVLLLVWILWPRRSNKQLLQRQSAVEQPQTTGPQSQPQTSVQQPQSTGQKPQTAEQQPQATGRKPQPPAADVRKPMAKNCPEGVYCDPDTNLMWTIKENGNEITWPDAEKYCKSLTLAGLPGWELPTIDELEKLYDPQSSNESKIRKPFGPIFWVWSSTKEGSGSAWGFSFGSGHWARGPVDGSVTGRALCVRRSGALADKAAAAKPPATDAKKPLAENCPEGVYCDPDTNLMWTIKDNGNDIHWPDAEQYCKNRTLAGLSGWELPTINELEELYDPQRLGYKIRKPFRLTECCLWSSTREGSGSSWYFDFDVGKRPPFAAYNNDKLRALCVRRSGASR